MSDPRNHAEANVNAGNRDLPSDPAAQGPDASAQCHTEISADQQPDAETPLASSLASAESQPDAHTTEDSNAQPVPPALLVHHHEPQGLKFYLSVLVIFLY